MRQSDCCRPSVNAKWSWAQCIHHLKVTVPKTIRRCTSEAAWAILHGTIFHLWGIIHPAKCRSEKCHYVEKADAQSDLQGVKVCVCVRERKWDRDRGVSAGAGDSEVGFVTLFNPAELWKKSINSARIHTDARRACVLGAVWWWRLSLLLDHHRQVICVFRNMTADLPGMFWGRSHIFLPFNVTTFNTLLSTRTKC